MACSDMPERDGKDQGEDSPKQAGSRWFARHSGLATCGANLYPPGGLSYCLSLVLRLFLFFVFVFLL